MKKNYQISQKMKSFLPYYFFSATVFLTTNQTLINSLQEWLNNPENINSWLINILLIFFPLSVLVSGFVFKNALDQGDQELLKEAQKSVVVIFLTLIMLVVSFFVVFT
jgi:predicted NACHT family NTPase